MTERDSELDAMLQPLRDLEPSSESIQLWQGLINSSRKKRPHFIHLIQLAATCLIGFTIGFLLKSKTIDSSEITINMNPTATIEVVYNKSE